jgi:hypothetical protein
MAIDLDEAVARTRRLDSAVADLAELPFDELPIEMLTALLATVEAAQRRLPTIGYDVINRLKAARVPAGGGRFRDYLANLLHISAADAGARITTAGALAAEEPTLPATAAAARHGLIGAEHVRIVGDTVDKLPESASDEDRGHFDVELAAIAVAERPEVLRREAAMLLAAFDAERSDPQTRDRSRAARRGFTLGPQDADGMSRGRFCLDPETRAYLEVFLAAKARPGMCNAADPLPTVDGEPEPMAAATDTRTTAQRNHDAVKAGLRAVLASGELGKHRGLPVTAIVTMTLQQLEAGAGVALTGGGSTVPIEVALRMAAHAHHYLYLYDANCGRPIFLGRAQRLASADQRIVLHAIDGGCTMPGCDQSAYHCQAHHLIEWSPDGSTDLDRLALVCEHNHGLAGRSEAEWQARRRYDEISLGQTLWYPPKSVDPSRQPRANRYHRRPKPPPAKPDAA